MWTPEHIWPLIFMGLAGVSLLVQWFLLRVINERIAEYRSLNRQWQAAAKRIEDARRQAEP